MEEKGKINEYHCDKDNHTIVTYNYDKGTTPFIIKCHCGNTATSQFYRVDQTNRLINSIWYKPCKEDMSSFTKSLREHIYMGGLIRMNLEKSLTVAEIEEYRNWAILNHKKGDKVPFGKMHPIAVHECRMINEKRSNE